MAKTDQELALEEINNRQYMYGGLGPFTRFFSGERREIIRPESTGVVGITSGPTGIEYITETIPAEYGPVEHDPSYSPVRRGLSALGDILYEAPSFFGLRGPYEQVEAIQGVGSSLRDALFGAGEYMSEQARAAASGGEYFDPETGRIVAFDPTITLFGGNPAEGAVMGSGFRMGRRAAEAAESKGFDTENIFLHGTSDRIEQPRSSATQSRDSGFIGRGFYGATEPRISDFYANSAPARFRDESGSFSNPNVFPYVTRRGNYKQYSLAEKQDLSRRVRDDEFLSQEITQKNIDDGFIGAEVVDAEGNIIERVNYFPEKDTRSAFLEADMYSGGRTGTGIAAASAGSAIAERMPPLSNAQRTQLGASTLPSYQKARKVLGEGRTLDFGAGRGQGAAEIGADTFEPYPREGFNPTYSSAADIPDESYENLTSLNVLNVMPRDVRDQAVADIGRVLAPGGRAVVTTRGRDVLNAKGTPGREPMSIITTADTYQKGFTQPELRDYIQSQLGEGFTISNLPEKIGQAGVLIEKTASPTALYSGGRTGTAIATGSSLRNFMPGEFEYDAGFGVRARERDQINQTEFRYSPSVVEEPKEISIFDLEGRPFVTTQSDRTDAGKSLLGVGEVDFDIPVELLGGQGYMFRNPGELWASGSGVTPKIYEPAMLAKKNFALGGTLEDPLLLPYRMSPKGSDFSHMTTDTMLTYARNAMDSKTIRRADSEIKSVFPEFKGIQNPESMRQLSSQPDPIRGRVRDILDKNFRYEGSLDLPTTRLAITEPGQYSGLLGGLQNVGQFDLSQGLFRGTHPSYPSTVPGYGLGQLKEKDISIFELMPEYVQYRGPVRTMYSKSGKPYQVGIDPTFRTNPVQTEIYSMQTGVRGAPGQQDPNRAMQFTGVITEDILRGIEARRAQ